MKFFSSLRKTGLLILVASSFFLSFSLGAQEKKDALQLYRNKQYREAVNVVFNELKSYPPSEVRLRMDSYSVLGWSLLGLKRYDDAVKYGLEALKFSPYDYRIIGILGEAYFYLGKSTDALRKFQEYVDLRRNSKKSLFFIYRYMGEIYLRKGRYSHAALAFETALHYRGNSARSWARLGYSRERNGEKKAALKAYQKSLALQPDLREAKRGLLRVQNS